MVSCQGEIENEYIVLIIVSVFITITTIAIIYCGFASHIKWHQVVGSPSGLYALEGSNFSSLLKKISPINFK